MLLRLVRLEAFRRPLPLFLIGLLALFSAGGAALAIPFTAYLAKCTTLALVGSEAENELIVLPRPPKTTQGFSMTFDRPLISADDMAFLETIPEVNDFRVLYGIPVPATGRFEKKPFFDTEQFVAIYAMDTEDIPAEHRARWDQTDGPVPVLVHPSVVRLYNLGFADRYALPRLQPEFLTEDGGLVFELDVGKDVFVELDGWRTTEGQIIGYSVDVPAWGITVPTRYLKPWMNGMEWPYLQPEPGPMQVTLAFADADAKAAGRQLVVNHGLVADGLADLAEQVGKAREVTEVVVQLLLVLLGLLAMASTTSLAAGMVAERRRPLALYRSHGARLPHLSLIFGGGLMFAAMLGAIAGTIIAHQVLVSQAPALAERLLGASLPNPPDPAFSWTWYLTAPALAGALMLIAVGPVLIGALRRPLLSDLRSG